MCSHRHNLGDDGFVRPLHTEDLCKLLEVVGCRLADREYGVTQPAHAQSSKLFVEEPNTQLACQERDVFDDGQANTPLLVLRKLDYSGEKGLGEELNSNHYR